MTKKIKIFAFIFPILMLISCASNSALVMPFEATFHKYVDTLTEGLEKIEYEATATFGPDGSYHVLCENENYSVIIYCDTLAFLDKKSGLFYDTFGNAYQNMPQTGLNIRITQGEDYELTYKSGKYYNSESDEYIDTLTAYKLNENSIRLLIVIGLDEFEIIGRTPIILTSGHVSAYPALKSYYSDDSSAKDKVLDEYPLLGERFDLTDDLYYLVNNVPESEFETLGLTKNTAREVALQLNYKYSDVKMILTTVDITLTDEGIIFDISKNRQFRSELIRDKSFIHEIFDFEIDFVEKTASESEKITDAQSKY